MWRRRESTIRTADWGLSVLMMCLKGGSEGVVSDGASKESVSIKESVSKY